MTTYDRIAELCKRRGISITALENELGFGRGSIGKLKKGITMSSARLQKIADRLETTTDYLLTGEIKINDEYPKEYYTNTLTALEAQQMYDDKRFRGLNHIKKNIDPQVFEMYYKMLIATYQKENPTDDYDFDE